MMQKTRQLNSVFAAIVLLLIGILSAGCQPKVESKPWEGRWIFSNVTSPDGDVMPLKGITHYYADGRFAFQLMEPDRLDLDADPETFEELENAFSTYKAGFGTYSVDEQAGTITESYDGNLRSRRLKKERTDSYELTPDGSRTYLSKRLEILIYQVISNDLHTACPIYEVTMSSIKRTPVTLCPQKPS